MPRAAVAAGGRKKAKKDPNAPKRALSSYMLFAADVRQQITANDPTLPMVEVSKKIGEQWQALEDDEKAPYEAKAAKLKQAYIASKAKYDLENPQTKQKYKGPKKPSSAYMYFSQNMRSQVLEENPNITFGQIGKEIGRRWAELEDDDKIEFEDKSEADKQRYKRESEEYQRTHPREEEPVEDKSNKKRKKDPNEPKRPLNAYMLFSQANRDEIKEENPTASIGEIAKILGQEWKELSPEDKEPYASQAAAAKEEYAVVIAAYQKKLAKKAKAAAKKAAASKGGAAKKKSSKKQPQQQQQHHHQQSYGVDSDDDVYPY